MAQGFIETEDELTAELKAEVKTVINEGFQAKTDITVRKFNITTYIAELIAKEVIAENQYKYIEYIAYVYSGDTYRRYGIKHCVSMRVVYKSEIKNILRGNVIPDKIYKCINNQAKEIKKIYKYKNSQSVVVWETF